MSELLYKTLRESVVNAIRAKIMNHQIRPGERIVELELAQEFHTSRGPIREALRQLEIEGIVEYTRNVGCSVRNFSVKDSYEVYLLRTNYEIVSIRLLNGKVPEDTIRNMENILEHMKSIPVNEFDRVFEYDNQFHEQLVLMSKLPRLEKAWKNCITVICWQDTIYWQKKKKYWNDSMIIILPSWRHAKRETVTKSARKSKSITGQPFSVCCRIRNLKNLI